MVSLERDSDFNPDAWEKLIIQLQHAGGWDFSNIEFQNDRIFRLAFEFPESVFLESYSLTIEKHEGKRIYYNFRCEIERGGNSILILIENEDAPKENSKITPPESTRLSTEVRIIHNAYNNEHKEEFRYTFDNTGMGILAEKISGGEIKKDYTLFKGFGITEKNRRSHRLHALLTAQILIEKIQHVMLLNNVELIPGVNLLQMGKREGRIKNIFPGQN